MPSSIEAPPATRYFYYVYLRSLSSITIFYKFDVDKQTLLPLAQNMLADPGNLSNFISLGSVESQLVLNILRQHRIIEDESKLTFPGVLQIEDSSIFQHFLPNKRRRAVAQPDTYSLLPTLSTEVPVYAPPLHYNAEHVLDALKSFKIGVGSSFLTFEEARLAIIVYSQLVRRRPFNLQHSETTRDSYVVDCYKPDCKFAVTVRVSFFLLFYFRVFTDMYRRPSIARFLLTTALRSSSQSLRTTHATHTHTSFNLKESLRASHPAHCFRD